MLFFNLTSYVKGIFFRNIVLQGWENMSIIGGAQYKCNLEKVGRGGDALFTNFQTKLGAKAPVALPVLPPLL